MTGAEPIRVEAVGVESIGGGGGPNLAPTIDLSAPMAGASFYVGAPVTVTGTADDDNGVVGVEVAVDSGTGQSATATTAGWLTWSVQVTLPSRGTHAITATARDSGGKTASESVQVVGLDASGPQLAILAPSASAPATTLAFDLVVSAVDPESGVRSVECSFAGGGYAAMAWDAATQTYRARLRVPTAQVPVGGTTYPVTVRATNGDGVQSTLDGSVPVIDRTPPAFDFTPADGVQIPGTANGADPTVVVSPLDNIGEVLTSGVARVQCRVDGGAFADASRLGTTGSWSVGVHVPAHDRHDITVRCTDVQGNYRDATHSVLVALPADIPDLSAQTYLSDLLDFATRRVLTHTGGSNITASHLTEAYGQPFAAIAKASPDTAYARGHTLRFVTDAVRGFLGPQPPAPVARWSLGEGTGTVVRDSASGTCDGSVVNGTWAAGRTGGSALSFNGTSTYVQVGTRPQLVMRDAVSIAAWLHPTGPGTTAGNGGTIVCKEAEYAAARFPDGTIRWAFATTTPGWNWVNTGVVVPAGPWTHVTVVLGGGSVRTYVNGDLKHTGTVSGLIGDADPAQNDLRIGGRQATAQFFQGELADVAVYDRALSHYEVKVLLGQVSAESEVWMEDATPPGVTLFTGGDTWDWGSTNPVPYSGTLCHRSATIAGAHQHFFQGGAFPVSRGDRLYAYVWLDPAAPPREVMLQWRDLDGAWGRAFWGEDLLPWGSPGTTGRVRMGPLPATGRWVRLEVPASMLGLEGSVVAGLAFSLFDGRAAWDRSGRTGWPEGARRSGHVPVAYRALLAALGTSYDELRLARGAPVEVRRALAARLGFPLSAVRPDELDSLVVPLDTVAETDLELLFGLPPATRTPPAGAVPVRPLLSTWRVSAQRARWRDEDLGVPGATDFRLPVVDPDVVGLADLAQPVAGNAGYDLWQQRTTWVGQQDAALRAVAPAATPAARVAAMLQQVFGSTDIGAIDKQRGAGQDITAQLDTLHLSAPAFNRLLELRALAATGPLLAAEWDDLVAILVRVLKIRNYPTWRQEERGRDLLLEPAAFATRPPDAALALPAWRADWPTRIDWQNRLRVRRQQRADLDASLAAAVDAAEEAALPVLRDALVAVAGTADPVIVANSLTTQLLIDVRTGGRITTTRIDQTIETMQSVLFAARTNRLQTPQPGLPTGPAARWVLDIRPQYAEAQFDQEWAWMGSYATWTAAMSVFLYPENLMLPSLRDDAGCTPAFFDLLDHLPSSGLTARQARDLAATYLTNLGSQVTLPAAMAGYVLTEQLSETQLDQRAALQQQLLTGVSTFAAIPAWLREVCYFVPLQLALSLQESGQYLSALDWYRTVYAYDRALARRAIFGGFALDHAGPPTLERPIEWLLHDLNPHAVATTRADAHLRFTLLSTVRCLLEYADEQFTADTAESRPRARSLYLSALDVVAAPELAPPSGAGALPLPPNPALSAYAGRATLNLAKLRTGLTIAGMQRPATPTPPAAAPTVVDGRPPAQPLRQPTSYRYATLISRAQQLLASASQVESAYLSSLEKFDAESYNLLRAGQDLELAKARVSLQQAQATVVDKEVRLAELQRNRAAVQQTTYSEWIAAGPNASERAMLASYRDANDYRSTLADVDRNMAITQAVQSAMTATTALGAIAGALGATTTAWLAGARATAAQDLSKSEMDAQLNAFQASQERRENEWRLQRSLADADFGTGQQQVAIAGARVAVSQQEAGIAQTQQAHAEASVNFLARKFTNADLYRWMSGVLASVYRYLLQQATSVAQLAERQLAFERQESPPAYIKADYWTVPARSGDTPSADRGGLTGSARLLEDLTQLDQYAFETNKRKLQLSHTLSLARGAPVDFQRFRDTGVLPFATTMDMFDRCFPGQYLRIIRRVRVSVVGLIPAAGGIRATLSSSGTSQVVVGGDTFRLTTLVRPPEIVALTSPVNATGVFELDAQPELLMPFEGNGVETSWELRMPKAANPLDYRTLADALVTIEYTALHSPEYAQQVIRQLPTRTSNALSFSLCNDFPDEWYNLVTAATDGVAGSGGLTARLALSRGDLPPNLDGFGLEQLTVLVIRADPAPGQAQLRFDRVSLIRGGTRLDSEPAGTVDDIVSTRSSSGTPLGRLLDTHPNPVGTWELVLTDTPATRAALRDGVVTDIVLVVSYAADLPAWPAP